MLSYNKKIFFNISHCQQCGSCLAVCPVDALSARLYDNGLSEICIDQDKCTKCRRCVKVCPANKKYEELSFDNLKSKKYYLGHNNDELIRSRSSSGGVAKTLLIDGLKNGVVDGAYSLYTADEYPFAEGRFYDASSAPTHEQIPNSVYHPVMLNCNLDKIPSCAKLLVVGTRCQLANVEKILKGKYTELIKICIFCKQQKTLDSTRFIAKLMNITIPEDKKFSISYRGDGWPGNIVITDKTAMTQTAHLPWEVAAALPFGKRLWRVPGCDICNNPFGDNVDITLMDPWSIVKPDKLGQTLIICHTDNGDAFLKSIPSLTITPQQYESVLPALDMHDIFRKQELTTYFRGDNCSLRVRFAGRLECFQRRSLEYLLLKIPRMPLLIYRILARFPDWRNMILKK